MRLPLFLAASVLLVSAPTAVLLAQDQPTAVSAGDAEAGKELYNAECKGCHSVSIAPTLRGVNGRRIAGVEAFGGYSPALKAKGDQTWTAQSLDAFLKAPTEFAPGTHMVKATPDAQGRADLVAYLMGLKPPAS